MAKKYKDVEEIPVFIESHKLTLKIYKVSEKFPKNEIFGLTSQLRRSSSSVPANIAEGFGRNTTKELLSFLYNARGSCVETRYHIMLSKDLKYLSTEEYKEIRLMLDSVGKQLNAWINSLKQRLVSH